MKTVLACAVAVVLGGAAATYFVATTLNARHATQLAAERAAGEQIRAELEAANAAANSRPRTSPSRPAPALPLEPAAPSKLTPAEYIARLQALRFSTGPAQNLALRQAVHDLEELLDAGTNALPAIREFLARNVDLDFNAGSPGRGGRITVPDSFVVPPSLRFGLLDVVKRIGGAEAEQLLADTLGVTARGVELAWITRALQETAPDKYRDTAVNIARELLGRPAAADGTVDRNDREHLFSILALYGDTSYAGTAQSQLVQADGDLDRAALKYLQQALGQQAVPVVAQMWQDPRLTDPAKKEPLARVALNFVGSDAQANDFYQKAINDLSLPKDHRRNLIEDLNQDGFPDRKNLGARDLPLIQNRLSLIERLAPAASDPINSAAFAEAYKDLLNMRERALRAPGR